MSSGKYFTVYGSTSEIVRRCSLDAALEVAKDRVANGGEVQWIDGYTKDRTLGRLAVVSRDAMDRVWTDLTSAGTEVA